MQLGIDFVSGSYGVPTLPTGVLPTNLQQRGIKTTGNFDKSQILSTYKKLQQEQNHYDGVEQSSQAVDDEKQMPKRKRDDKVQKQKHSDREKKRRMEMNEAIDRLKASVPKTDKTNSAKPDRVGTKVNILNDAADYIEKLENLVKNLEKEKQQLIEENHQLLLQLNRGKGWDDCKAPMSDPSFSLGPIPDLVQPNNPNALLPPNLPQHFVTGQPIQTFQQQLQAQQFQIQAAYHPQLLFPGMPWGLPIQSQQLPRTPGPNTHPNPIQSPILNPNQPNPNPMVLPNTMGGMPNQMVNPSGNPLNHNPSRNNSLPMGMNLMPSPSPQSSSPPSNITSPQQSLLGQIPILASSKMLTPNDLILPSETMHIQPPQMQHSPNSTEKPNPEELNEVPQLNLSMPLNESSQNETADIVRDTTQE